MRFKFSAIYSARFFCIGISVFYPIGLSTAEEFPRTFILEASTLAHAKTRAHAKDPVLLPALNRLKRDADVALEAKIFSVTQKNLRPPSGDKHDYMSVAPYWWPNPNSSNGLPYVRRDGEINPERDKTSDRHALDMTVQTVKTLAYAYFFTGNEAYASRAAKVLRVWFLDKETGMSPNLKFAQAIPGRNHGRAAGIIETHNLPELVDAVALLAGSKSWTSNDQKALQNWFGAYLQWLLESPEGKSESTALNNHGSWYDVQTAAFALFVERKELASKILADFPHKRIAKQIEPDGRQPRELERTQSWNYSVFNLEAVFAAASIGDKVGLDLWSFETADGRSMRKALDWLLSFATGEKKWNDKQISGWQPEKLAPFLKQAGARYGEPLYKNALTKIPAVTADSRMHLLYPN